MSNTWTVVWTFLAAHQVIETLLFAQAVNAMPMPTNTSTQFYRWIFTFLTSISNAMRASASMGPKGQRAPEPPAPKPLDPKP